MIRTVLLVNPPQTQLLEGFPGSLIPLAGFVASRAPGVDVRLLDLAHFSVGDIAGEMAREMANLVPPVLVGITTTTASYQRALRVARAAKQLGGDVFVAMGGHHASPQAEVILRRHPKDVDFVVRGEGELALLDLVQRLPDISMVRGVSYRNGDEVVHRPSPPMLSQEELDTLPVQFTGERIQSAPGKFLTATYISARGCPLSCHFCSVANETLRAKSIQSVIADLRHLVGAKGYKRIALEDNFFAASPRRTIALCAAIEELRREPLMDFTWDCQTRVESMQDPELLAAMERAGCIAVYLGVESLNNDHLRYLGKTLNPERYLRLLKDRVVPMLLESSVDCYINLQLGLPDEGEHHREMTLRTLRELGAAAHSRGKSITVFPQLHVMYPGTRHFVTAVSDTRFGDGTSEIFEEFTAWEEQQQPILRWLGEHFAHGTGGIPVGILDEHELRLGRFQVNATAIHRVSEYLEAMDAVPGIELFKYGRFLTTSEGAKPGLALA